MLDRRQARMAKRSGGLGHIVTPAGRLARIAHDPQHVGERQLTGCGCFLSSCDRAADRNPRAVRSVSGSTVPQCGTARNVQRGAVLISSSATLSLDWNSAAVAAVFLFFCFFLTPAADLNF
jgi:hypothetical protein